MREKRFKNTDWIVLIISIALLGIGLVALYSATQSTKLFEFKKQVQWAIISIPFLIIVYFIDYKFIVKFSPVFYIIFVGLLVGVLFTEPISGARSWFKIDESFAMQPSELAKIVIIMFMSFILYKLQLKGKREINKPWKLAVYFVFWGIPLFLIYKQPDLRNSFILCYSYVIYAFCIRFR